MASGLAKVSDLAMFLDFSSCSGEPLATHGKQPLASGRQNVESATEWEDISRSSPLEGLFPSWGHLARSGDIFGVTAGAGDATDIWWVEARDTAKHLTVHRTVPTKKNHEALKAKSATLKEVWHGVTASPSIGV